MTLLAAPNVSEGRDFARLDRLESALGAVTMLDRHTDLDHNRAVFTVAGSGDAVERALDGLARIATTEIDMTSWRGIHPAIGALDVSPVIWIREEDREKAGESALRVSAAIGELGVPVFLYGDLATTGERRERAFFRRGGVDELWMRMSGDDPLRPDFGPDQPHPTAGACLVTARPPLAAFNLELETDDVSIAKEIAAAIREKRETARPGDPVPEAGGEWIGTGGEATGGGAIAVGGGLPGVRALGLSLSTGRAQVSTNVHDPVSLPLARVVEAVKEQAEVHGTRVVEAELIGLLPRAAVEGYPDDVPIRDFDPAFHLIENRI
ncbi:MAG: hypothetical protein M3Y45_03445 [Actinomycetota bacterium]|nr:hypothetical protein [Actinomycetota bacterium]